MTDKKFVFKHQQKDNDDDHEYLGTQCFQISPNVEEKEIPTNGEEYLLKVIKERAKCATITKCNLDASQTRKKLCNTVKEHKVPEKPEKLKPTIEWQNIQIADFSDLHMYVVRMAARKKAELPTIFQDTYRDFMQDGEIQWMQVFESTEPTLSHVVGLSHGVVETGLDTILSILQRIKPGESIDRRTGLWLHALLTVARHPPQSDDSFLLRNLCRRCAEIRAGLNLDDENARELATPLNIFICIIAKYFGQHDLGDYELHDSKVGQIYYDSKVAQIFY
ncbi:gem-associated protein 2-like isoform X2 [Helicoverpa zea]|uniref:gem-associated protein 2-like isoform X2 n=1 Tax=Helicoverpa zea TaxID=7113 RepID=UPI001F58E2C5|nr:gem-associated protein 2-like isoform X2 [Helicoverpa zea]